MDREWWRYYSTKKSKKGRMDREGNPIDFLLSFDELMSLVEDAGISRSDVGKHTGQYHLARDNDIGHYEIGNCRFIPTEENIAERNRYWNPILNKLR